MMDRDDAMMGECGDPKSNCIIFGMNFGQNPEYNSSRNIYLNNIAKFEILSVFNFLTSKARIGKIGETFSKNIA